MYVCTQDGDGTITVSRQGKRRRKRLPRTAIQSVSTVVGVTMRSAGSVGDSVAGDAARLARKTREAVATAEFESVDGKRDASVLGCNVNNDNSSVRTLNANNALSNGNDNYAGGFAVNFSENERHCVATRDAVGKTKHEGNHAATGGYGRCDYGSEAKAEGNAEMQRGADYLTEYDIEAEFKLLCGDEEEYRIICGIDDENGNDRRKSKAKTKPKTIWDELAKANSKRRLKNLKRFFLSREIVKEGVRRALKKARNSKAAAEYFGREDELVERILKDFREGTFRMGHITKRKLPPKTRDGKERLAEIYTVYDRCVCNVLLLIIQQKMNNTLTRNVYSGVKGRALFSNDRTYCMVNQIRHYVETHQRDYVMLTDIRHFYQSLKSEVALGCLFKTIVCPFTRKLLAEILLALPHVPIGSPLSQLIAMACMNEMDRIILRKFRPRMYCIFGDNRLIGGDREMVIKAKEYEDCYLEARYGLMLKGDYSLHRVSDGFRFCKYDFYKGYVFARAELRRRAARSYIKGRQHYAGHKGILDKTDSNSIKNSFYANLRMHSEPKKDKERDDGKDNGVIL